MESDLTADVPAELTADLTVNLWIAENIYKYYNITNFNKYVKSKRSVFIDMLIRGESVEDIVEHCALDTDGLCKAITKDFIASGIIGKSDFIALSAIQDVISLFTKSFLIEDRGYTDIFGKFYPSLRAYLENPRTIRELLVHEL